MPSYTYKCDKCGHAIDRLHAPRTRVTLPCSECGHEYPTWQFPCPNIQSETTFLANRDDGFGNDNRSRRVAMARAKAAGVSTAGKLYCPGLCPPGESLSPKAWITDKADARRICRENNWSSETLGVKSDRIETEPKPYRVADDLVADEVKRVVKSREGDVSPKEHENLKHEVREQLTGAV